jgi:hypothetical protein
MDNNIFIDLHNKAEEFGSLARLVNESSRFRKTRLEEAITLIKQSLEIGDIINHEFEIISRANVTMRDQDTMIQNYCFILDSNISRQKEIIHSLKGGPYIRTAVLSQLEEMIRSLSTSMHKAIILLHMIIQNDSDIILMDNLIMSRKRFQRDAINELKKLAFRTIEDADSAIRGSLSNIRHGLDLADHLSKVKEYSIEKKADMLAQLIDEAYTGWNIAAAVNRNSITQLEFDEQVSGSTVRLCEDSHAICDLVINKHKLFLRNQELTTELSVILSLEIKDFLAAGDLIGVISHEAGLPNNIRGQIKNLMSYVIIACKDIEFVSNLNFDMSESIKLNADLEKKSTDLTKTELEYFNRIRDEVHSMTEATKHPLLGSEKNIENGKLLEQYLRKIRDGAR